MESERILQPIKVNPGEQFPVSLPLPQTKGKCYDVLKIDVHNSRWYTVCCTRPFFAITHFVNRRTLPCLRSIGQECQWCGAISRRYQGFLLVWDRYDRKTKLLALTESCIEKTPILNPDCHESLVGLEIRPYRIGRTKHSPLRLEFKPEGTARTVVSKVFSAVNVRDHVLSMWGHKVKGEIHVEKDYPLDADNKDDGADEGKLPMVQTEICGE